MKLMFISLASLLMISSQKCKRSKSTQNSVCYKGRLEVKGICANYTVAVLEGNIDTSKVVATWKDETTGKMYKNVFALGNPCGFPERLNAGDEFYFTLDDPKEHCNVCLAYYPTPQKRLSVKVLDQPCN